MTFSKPVASFLVAVVVALVASLPVGVHGQVLERLPNIYPLNGLLNPYASEDGWVKLPNGRIWGSTAGTDIDPDGRHIWAIDRCGANSCAGSDLDPILKIDPDGNVVTTMGGGLFLFPHGMHVDRDGNVWVTDARGPDPNNAATAGKGHVVIKLSPEGEVPP